MTDDTIVVGADAQSRRALRWAVRQAELAGARVEAVIAWEPPFSGTGSGVAVGDPQALRDTAHEVLAESIEKAAGPQPAVAITARAEEGTPVQVLLKATGDENVTLLVVGSRGLGGFAGALLGSVGRHCARHAPCPVPVVIVRGRYA
ncbi:universal stress protein [Kitasatospora sp. NPDC001159]